MASSWFLGPELVEDGAFTECLGTSIDDRVPAEALAMPEGDEDFESEFPLKNFQSELGEADLDRLQHDTKSLSSSYWKFRS